MVRPGLREPGRGAGLGSDHGLAEVAAPSSIPAVPTEADLLAALDRTEAMVAGGVVPPPVVSRVKRITATVRQTLPRLRNLGLGSPEAYSVMATATDYLPEALGAYTPAPPAVGGLPARSRTARPP